MMRRIFAVHMAQDIVMHLRSSMNLCDDDLITTIVAASAVCAECEIYGC